jgi:hypothetical protein
LGDFYGEYSMDEHWIRRHFEDGDLRALGEFTQGVYLDMKPAHEVRQDRRIKMAENKRAKENETKYTPKGYADVLSAIRKLASI